MISKPITIQLFPGYSIKHQCYGTDLPGKDLLIGFNIFKTLPQINWMHKGLHFKHHFLPWTSQPNLFLLDTFVAIHQALVEISCAETHSEFLKKCSHPLWKNPDFFILLPLKKNEDINPTKASH